MGAGQSTSSSNTTRGPAGPQGPVGPRGPAGPAGPQGLPGMNNDGTYGPNRLSFNEYRFESARNPDGTYGPNRLPLYEYILESAKNSDGTYGPNRLSFYAYQIMEMNKNSDGTYGLDKLTENQFLLSLRLGEDLFKGSINENNLADGSGQPLNNYLRVFYNSNPNIKANLNQLFLNKIRATPPLSYDTIKSDIQTWINTNTPNYSITTTNKFGQLYTKIMGLSAYLNGLVPYMDILNIIQTNPTYSDTQFLVAIVEQLIRSNLIPTEKQATARSYANSIGTTNTSGTTINVMGFQNYKQREGFVNNYASVSNENGSAVAWHSKLGGSPFSPLV